MYLRKTHVRSGGKRRSYVSIAHNVWTRSKGCDAKRLSRPICLVNLGPADQIDEEVAQELLGVMKQVFGSSLGHRGTTAALTYQLALDLRRTNCAKRLSGLARKNNAFRCKLRNASERQRLIAFLLNQCSPVQGDGVVGGTWELPTERETMLRTAV